MFVNILKGYWTKAEQFQRGRGQFPNGGASKEDFVLKKIRKIWVFIVEILNLELLLMNVKKFRVFSFIAERSWNQCADVSLCVHMSV